MFTEKHVFVKETFTDGLNIDFPQEEKTHWLSSKEKVLGIVVS